MDEVAEWEVCKVGGKLVLVVVHGYMGEVYVGLLRQEKDV